jgi:hypothetical protein
LVKRYCCVLLYFQTTLVAVKMEIGLVTPLKQLAAAAKQALASVCWVRSIPNNW